MISDCCVLNSSGVVWTENIFLKFRKFRPRYSYKIYSYKGECIPDFLHCVVTVESMILIFIRLMDKNEEYNFESLSGASNLEEVLYDFENVSFHRTFGFVFNQNQVLISLANVGYFG